MENKTFFIGSFFGAKRFILLSLIFLFAGFIVSCGTDALQISGEWYFEGLNGAVINKIIPSSDVGGLLLATDNGVFIYEEGQITSAGLQGEEVYDIVVMNDDEFLAGVRVFELDVGEPTLFKTTDRGGSWQTFMGNYGGKDGKFTRVAALAVHPDNPQHIFARGMLNVSRSMDGGHTWESLYKDWDWFGSNASLLKIDPENPDIIWAGGANTVSNPNIIKSVDGGATWVNLWRELQIFESRFISTAYSIAIRSGRSSHLLLGLGVGIFRSKDLGESWESVFNEASVFTLATSSLSDQSVYASGINQQQTLFLLATHDFGDSWQALEMANSPREIFVNDISVVEQGGKEVLFLGTNQGLYSFHLNE